MELLASATDPTLVLVALVGGGQPAVMLEELQAHLSLRFCVSVATAEGVSASSPLVGFGELNDNAIKDLTKFAKC
jgi:hypothetical protein